MEKAKLMQLEIEEKRKLPKKIKDSISTDIFQDLIVAIIIMAYFCIINFSYYNVESHIFEENMKYFALAIIILTVIAFEISYRKNSIKLLIIGLELFACAILSLYIPYIFLHSTSAFRISIMILPAFLIIYYAIKSFVIFKSKQFQYRNNLSDIKEIVKDTEKMNYIEEESTKSYRQKVKQEQNFKEEVRREEKIKKIKKEEAKKRLERKRNRDKNKKEVGK